MRFFRSSFIIVALALACPMVAIAEEPLITHAAPEAKPAETWPAPLKDDPSREERIDSLYTELKRERSADGANAIAQRLWRELNDSGSPTVNLLMKWADDATKDKRNAAAFDFLDQAAVLEPDFAGVWNRRALLNHALGNDKKAMSDLNRVLEREPRHLIALAALAAILEESGDSQGALTAWQRYLDFYPADRDAQNKVTTLSEKIAGSRA